MPTFYDSLKPFSRFAEVLENRHYTPVPADWLVVVTDVKGSTAAIKEGRYRDVNTLGVASLVAVKNALPNVDFPFVFGGDGVTMVIPPDAREQVENVLLGVQDHAQAAFKLELRAGIVPMADITAAGATLLLAKQQLVGKQGLAMFRGGGLSVADDLVKNHEKKYAVHGTVAVPHFDGLSCRWQPLPNKNGGIMALVVKDMVGDEAVYAEVLAQMYAILGEDMAQANPVNVQSADYKSLWRVAAEEKVFHKSVLAPRYWVRLLQIFLAGPVFRFKLPIFTSYTANVHAHSDFRKFDDTLRMIVDCSPEQVEKIRGVLEGLYQQHRLVYGCHVTDNALMTCYVPSISDGGHVHFIDADQGGYAMAATGMKAQIKTWKK